MLRVTHNILLLRVIVKRLSKNFFHPTYGIKKGRCYSPSELLFFGVSSKQAILTRINSTAANAEADATIIQFTSSRTAACSFVVADKRSAFNYTLSFLYNRPFLSPCFYKHYLCAVTFRGQLFKPLFCQFQFISNCDFPLQLLVIITFNAYCFHGISYFLNIKIPPTKLADGESSIFTK